jgi:cytochrome c-type biogenesis protein CcmH/NrfF
MSVPLALLLAASLALQSVPPANTPHNDTIAPASMQGIAPPAVSREDSILEARTKAVASHLRCPVCQGLSLQDSPSGLAQEMRNVVKEQLRAGKSEEEVKAYFVSKYGEWILLEPPARGFNLAVYLLPVGLLVGGAVLVVTLARKWSRGGEPRPPAQPETEEELEPELK